MSLSPVSGGSAAYPQPNQNTAFRTSFQQLTSAISSGDTQGAQQALTTLQQSAGQVDSNSPLGQLLSALGSDLSSGNISGAQQTLQAFQQAHGHHHHRPPSGDQDSGSTDAGDGSTGAVSGSGGILA